MTTEYITEVYEETEKGIFRSKSRRGIKYRVIVHDSPQSTSQLGSYTQPALPGSQPALPGSQPALPGTSTPKRKSSSGSTKNKPKRKSSSGSAKPKSQLTSHAKTKSKARVRGYHRPDCIHGQQMKLWDGRISQKRVRVVISNGSRYLVCRKCNTVAKNPVPAAAVRYMSS